jgi:hypothetical protein
MGRECSRYGERILVGKPEGRPRCRLEDNTKIDLKRGWFFVDWIDLTENWDQCEHYVHSITERSSSSISSKAPFSSLTKLLVAAP